MTARATTARGGHFTTARVADGVIVRRALHRERLLRDGAAPAVVERLLAEADASARALGDGMVRVSVPGGVEARAAKREPWATGDAPLRFTLRPDPREGRARYVKACARAALDALDEEARSLGCDGAVLEGPGGALREGTWFSLVLLVGGAWCAPPLGEGVIYSTTRAAFRAPLVERRLTRADLARCEGALALSALLGAAPVSEAGGISLGLGLESPSRFV